MKRSVNGHNKYTDKITLTFFDGTEKRDESLRRWQENSQKTNAARTEETKLKQKSYKDEKENCALIVAENEAKIKAIYTDELVDKLVASFGEIGIEKTFEKKEIRQLFANLLEWSNLVQDNEKLNKRKMPLYNEFLIRIAAKYPDFILYLPAKCFTHTLSAKLHLGRLNSEQIEILEKKLAKDHVFSDEIFKKQFIKYFPTHIAEMNAEQATYALSVCPSAFNLLNENSKLRSSFNQSPQILVSILRNSPSVLQYLSQKEIELIPEESIAVVGYAIKYEPQVLENLPSNFFKKHHPKYVFQTIKHKVKHNILDYYKSLDVLNKFPELAAYFSAKSIVANPSKSNGSKKRIENQGINPEITNEIEF